MRLIIPVLTAVLLSVIALPIKCESLATKLAFAQLLDTKNSGQQILVTFKDQTIDKVQGTASAYRKRGDYDISTWSQRISDNLAEDYHLHKLIEWPMTAIGVHCIVYQVPANQSVQDTLQRLSQDKRVQIAQNMHVFSTQAQSSIDPYFKLQANMRTMQIEQAHKLSTGKNVTITMIDTGVDLQHPDLIGQISENENFATTASTDFANDQHGTAVAGVMVAKRHNGTGIVGVAPDAKVNSLKACWSDKADNIKAVCNSLTLALAVNTAIKSGAKILNMSLTGPHDDILELLLNQAIEEGMIIVAANTGQGQADSNFPGSLKNIISVQSAELSFENRSSLVSAITAPGEKILTTLPYGTYDFISGSSIAAAEVSGIIALLMELKPDLTLAETQAILKKAQLPVKLNAASIINANSAVLALSEKPAGSLDLLSLAAKKL